MIFFRIWISYLWYHSDPTSQKVSDPTGAGSTTLLFRPFKLCILTFLHCLKKRQEMLQFSPLPLPPPLSETKLMLQSSKKGRGAKNGVEGKKSVESMDEEMDPVPTPKGKRTNLDQVSWNLPCDHCPVELGAPSGAHRKIVTHSLCRIPPVQPLISFSAKLPFLCDLESGHGLLLFEDAFTSFFKDKKSQRNQKTVGIKVFLTIFA